MLHLVFIFSLYFLSRVDCSGWMKSNVMQSALTDARDHVYEMSEKEVNIIF